jgi:uncharacterized YigZ family protein
MRVRNSRFIATIAPVFSVDEARAFVDRIKREFPDATHNVPAYLIGHGASVTAHCSDGGEPGGTAGPPALSVLRGSGLGDVAVVITRYFGGTKLGTGGLVRAYADAVRQVLSVLPRGVKLDMSTVRIETPYDLFEKIRRLVLRHQGQVLEETFRARVTLSARLPEARLRAFRGAVQELSQGEIEPQVIESAKPTAVPLETNDLERAVP